MNANSLRKLCMALPEVTEQIQRKNDRVFKNGGKMSVCSGLASSSRYFFRAGDGFLELSDFPGIRPAPYLARAKWVQIDPAICQFGDAELICLFKDSYQQVLQKLPKKTQAAIAERV